MGNEEPPFFGKESLEDKIRKYTKPHPVVTSHLRNNASKFYRSHVTPTTFSTASQVCYPSQWQWVQPSYPFIENRVHPMPRTYRIDSVPSTATKLNPNRKRSHSCSATMNISQDSSYGKHKKSDLPRDTKSGGKYSRLTHQIKLYTIDHSQSEELLDRKLKLSAALLCVIRRQFPGATLHLVGSSCNGFASDSSDADFCIMIDHERNIDQMNEARCYLKAIERLIQPMTSLEDLQFICAKVPILKFKDAISGCECDVNVNNSVGIRNTHLLRTYSKLDNRVRPLVLALKMWGKARGINDASQGTLSSYSLVLMALHFLQCGCNPPVLPSLQEQYPRYFQSDLSIDELAIFEPARMIPCNKSDNNESVGELLVGFFRYFAETFLWDIEIMSVRLGCTLLKKQQVEFKHKYICIEEPFNRTNTAHSVYDLPQFLLIKKEFGRANDRLKGKMSLEYIS